MFRLKGAVLAEKGAFTMDLSLGRPSALIPKRQDPKRRRPCWPSAAPPPSCYQRLPFEAATVQGSIWTVFGILYQKMSLPSKAMANPKEDHSGRSSQDIDAQNLPSSSATPAFF